MTQEFQLKKLNVLQKWNILGKSKNSQTKLFSDLTFEKLDAETDQTQSRERALAVKRMHCSNIFERMHYSNISVVKKIRTPSARKGIKTAF